MRMTFNLSMSPVDSLPWDLENSGEDRRLAQIPYKGKMELAYSSKPNIARS